MGIALITNNILTDSGAAVSGLVPTSRIIATTAPLTGGGDLSANRTIAIPAATTTVDGYLSAVDWTTFNSKQVAGNYVTSLTGEATGTGPGATAVTLNNASVTGKVLTGVNITGGTVLATDTMLTAFGKLQNQINGLVGSTIYQGVWNASTNNPTLTSSVGTNGFYYIVNVAGATNLNGITDWKVGDWAIFNGGVWQKVDNTESVTSVNGFTGAVSLTTDNIAQGTTNLYFANSLARTAVSLTTTGSSGAATYNNTTGIFNIPNYGTALANYLPLTGGTLTGALVINPANSAVIGLDAASDTFRLRSDSTQPFARQLATTMGSGTLVKMQAAGFGGTYVTDLGFYTSSSSAINTTPNLYLTGGNNRVGINTTTPAYTLDVVGTAGVSGVLTLGSTISNGTFTYTLPGATGTLALVGGSGVGTVTSVAALTLGTTGADLSSSVANSTTTPVITLNVPTASAINRGVLSAADWTTFNAKQTALNGTGFVKIVGTTISYDNSTYYLASNPSGFTSNVGTVTSVGLSSATSGVTIGATPITTSGTITLAIATASGAQQGLLSSADWTTFNNKAPSVAGGYLPLSGGTLTGALGGTSATFVGGTGGINFTSSTTITNTASSGFTAIYANGGGIYLGGSASTNHLSIVSTGAATFSSSVLANSFNIAANGTIASNSFWGTLHTKGAGSYSDWSLISPGGSGIMWNPTGTLNMSFGGNVGIGTTAPGFPLEVYTVNGSIANFNSGRTGGGGISMANSGSVRLYLGQANWLGLDGVTSGNNAISLSSGQAADIIFATNVANASNGERMRITSSGNVLIGSTTDPGYKLYVNGQIYSGAITSSSVMIATSYTRNVAGTGFLNGKYSLVETTATTGPIYCLGDSYAPTATSINNMYGIGYSYNNFTGAYGPVNDWGMYVVGGGIVGIYLSAGGNGYFRGAISATSFFESSDATIKTLITDNYQAKGIESVVAKLYTKNGKEELGYFAQDVQGILPSAVSKGADGLLSLSYREVHTAKIARLEKEVEELKSQLARL